MKATGVVRKIDELGRIVLPIELRRALNIENKDSMEIYVTDDSIVLKQYHPGCVFCGEGSELTQYMGKNICAKCLNQLKAE